MKNVTLRQLRVFVAVARHLSFVRAAEELALSGPAVSMQIKDMEAQVGLPLFDRSSRSVSLTKVGTELLAHAARVLAAMRDADDLIANVKGLQGGALDLAMVDTASYFVPRMLALFRRDRPNVEARLRVVDNRESIAQLLRQGEVELAIMGRPSGEWATAEPFAPNPQVLVTAVDHPFTQMKRVSPQALQREVFITREPLSGTWSTLQKYLQEHQLTVGSIMQMSSNEAIKQAVMAGMGISLLPLHTLGLELDQGLIAAPAVEGLPVIRHWHVIRNTGKVLSPAAEAFRQFMLEEGDQFLAHAFLAVRAYTAPADGSRKNRAIRV
jgi:LysR family transcriptional regulator, low CO2-responsive transcriptional regulator